MLPSSPPSENVVIDVNSAEGKKRDDSSNKRPMKQQADEDLVLPPIVSYPTITKPNMRDFEESDMRSKEEKKKNNSNLMFSEKQKPDEEDEMMSENARKAGMASLAVSSAFAGMSHTDLEEKFEGLQPVFSLTYKAIDPLLRRGLLVTAVTPGGPCEESGIKQGDVIRKIAQQAVNHERDVARVLGEYQAADPISLDIARGDNDMFFETTLSGDGISAAHLSELIARLDAAPDGSPKSRGKRSPGANSMGYKAMLWEKSKGHEGGIIPELSDAKA